MKDAGCLCWECSKLGSCPYACCKIKNCQEFNCSDLTYAEIGKILGKHERTINIYIKRRGHGFIKDILEQKGFKVFMDDLGDRKYFFIKEKYKSLKEKYKMLKKTMKVKEGQSSSLIIKLNADLLEDGKKIHCMDTLTCSEEFNKLDDQTKSSVYWTAAVFFVKELFKSSPVMVQDMIYNIVVENRYKDLPTIDIDSVYKKYPKNNVVNNEVSK